MGQGISKNKNYPPSAPSAPTPSPPTAPSQGCPPCNNNNDNNFKIDINSPLTKVGPIDSWVIGVNAPIPLSNNITIDISIKANKPLLFKFNVPGLVDIYKKLEYSVNEDMYTFKYMNNFSKQTTMAKYDMEFINDTNEICYFSMYGYIMYIK